MMSDRPIHFDLFMEVAGDFRNLTVEDDQLIARIGKIAVSLPLEMERSLKPLIGQKITILKTDISAKPYLFRVLKQ
jgi:hypothetical protein